MPPGRAGRPGSGREGRCGAGGGLRRRGLTCWGFYSQPQQAAALLSRRFRCRPAPGCWAFHRRVREEERSGRSSVCFHPGRDCGGLGQNGLFHPLLVFRGAPSFRSEGLSLSGPAAVGCLPTGTGRVADRCRSPKLWSVPRSLAEAYYSATERSAEEATFLLTPFPPRSGHITKNIQGISVTFKKQTTKKSLLCCLCIFNE